MADNYEYLEPGFDPASLTVPRLRSILVSHDIPYPASAKKAQLIEILQSEVMPQAKKLLAAKRRVQRTSRGITDVPSSQSSTGGPDDEDEEMDEVPEEFVAPPTVRGGRRTTRSTVSRDRDEEPVTPAPARRSTTRSKTPATMKHSRASETDLADMEAPPTTKKRVSTARKTRVAEQAPVLAPVQSVETDDSDGPVIKSEQDDSPFSNDNPFQSGSSPSAALSPRRKSAGISSERRKTSARLSSPRKQRLSEAPAQQLDGDIHVPTRSTFEMPVSRLSRHKQPSPSPSPSPAPEDFSSPDPDDQFDFGPTEEFTAEEQLEIVRDRAKNGEWDVALPARKKQRAKASKASKAAPWVVLLSIFGGFGTYWRNEKVEIGYCGVGKDTWSLSETQVPEWADVLQPQCEPCPQHAYCFPNLETRCETDFVLKPHPLSMGGLVPLPPTCEPDGEKVRRVKAVADRAIEELRERRAKWECGELVDENGKEIPAVEIPEKQLKEEVGKKRKRGMSQEEFEDLWKGAIGEISAKEEVTTGKDG